VGLDLTLFSISNKAKFVLEKAKSNVDYANDFDKIQDTDSLKLHLKMVQAHPDGTTHIIQDLIEDSKIVLSHYPDHKTDKYQFYSRTRGYETLNYLLTEYLKDNHICIENEKVFFGGADIFDSTQFVRFQYLDNLKTLEISNLLQPIDFSNIVKFYDYQKMESVVYKLTRPENLDYLNAEFKELKTFFNEATKLDAFIVVKVY
jgi:Domain of unknown function (DUF1877)